MLPETKAYFDEIEPLFDLLCHEGLEITLDVSSLTSLTLDQIRTLSSFFDPIRFTSMERMLDQLWMTFTGSRINYLLDKPRYTAFRITVIDNHLDVEVTSENCGRHHLSCTVDGKAQRRYLYRLLSKLHTNIQPWRHIDQDIKMTYDGKNITLDFP